MIISGHTVGIFLFIVTMSCSGGIGMSVSFINVLLVA